MYLLAKVPINDARVRREEFNYFNDEQPITKQSALADDATHCFSNFNLVKLKIATNALSCLTKNSAQL